MRRIAISAAITLLAVLFVAMPVMAQEYAFLCYVTTSPDGTWSMRCAPYVAPTPAPTATATATPIPPTATATALPPTATALPATPTSQATATSVPPTATQPAPTATATAPAPTATATSPVSPLPTPVATATATAPVSPLPTPAATATMVMPMPTPTSGPVAAWKCPDSLHNKSVYHDHYNEAAGCWYDHVHGSDPNSIAYRFGPLWDVLRNYPTYNAADPAWQLGGISYPWLTGGGMEQEHKHGGYKWLVADIAPQNADVIRIADNGGDYNWITGNGPWSDIVAMRIESHLGSMFAMPDGSQMGDSGTRFHSLWAEYMDRDGGRIGGGGWTDTGRFWWYSNDIIPMPSDPNPVSPLQTGVDGHFSDPYRGDSFLCENLTRGIPTPALWTSRPPWAEPKLQSPDYQHNNHLGAFTVAKDISACTDRAGQQHLICPDGSCRWANNTDFGPYRAWAYLSPAYDNDKAGNDKDPRVGYVTMFSWTDRRGLPAPACTKPALDCVPFYAIAARVGWHSWNSGLGQPYVASIDHDQTPKDVKVPYINVLGN